MSETDRRPAPTLWMFLLVLLGLYTIPRGASNALPASSKPESKRPDSGQAPESSRARNAGESGSVDRLLLDYFSLGRRGEVSGSPDAVGAEDDRPGAREVLPLLLPGQAGRSVRVARRAVGAEDDRPGAREVLPPRNRAPAPDPLPDRHAGRPGPHHQRLPLRRGADGDPSGHRGTAVRPRPLSAPLAAGRGRDAGRGLRGAPSPPKPGRPGLLICRYEGDDPKDQQGPAAKAPPLLLVFLVPEIATAGLDKEALAEEHRLGQGTDDHRRAIDPEPPATKSLFNILGPAFTGSQASLEHALRVWIAQRPQGAPPPHFEVVSGSASGIDSQSLKKNVESASGSLTYRTTVHRQRVVERAMCAFLEGDGGAGVGRPIALLYESNTGYGQATEQPKERDCSEIHYYPFPQNVARIRALYEKQDESGGASQFLPPSERLVPGSDSAKWPLDLIAPQTPEFTTPLDELVIDEILMDISHREIRTVGITATDAHDVIFLAGKIRRMIPDARVFTTENDLVFTHPERIADLRGMFVASTYPLLARNQSWSYPYRGERRSVFFTSDDAQGIYNATVLQLHDLLDEGPVRPDPTSWNTAGRSRCPAGQARRARRRKPALPSGSAWSGTTGSIPSMSMTVRPATGIPTAAEQGQSEPDDIYHHQFKPVAGAASEDSVENAGTLFYPSFRRDWLLLFLGLSATCLGLAGVAFVQAAWSRRLRSSAEGLDLSKWPPFLRRVAVFLNWAPFLGAWRCS